MDGKKLIEEICKILDTKDIRRYDSNIVIKLSELTQVQLENLVNGKK